MSGSGNDFILVDNRKKKFPADVSRWAKKLCCRQEGIGADGLLLIENSRKADFRMIYYNSDGSHASMCGNGGRCISWLARHLNIVRGAFSFESDAGLIHGEVHGDVAEIQLGDANDYWPPFSIRVGGCVYPVSHINTGVPHVVMLVRRVDDVDVNGVGRALRFHKVFGRSGANVNFVQRLNDNTLSVRTYERGVEAETLACGTGVSASAIVMALRGMVRAPVHCRVRGGDVLVVDFDLHPQDKKHPVTRVTLKGPVRLTFTGKITL